MNSTESFSIGLYAVTLVMLAVFGIHRYIMVYLYYRHRKSQHQAPAFDPARAPRVTIQLPLFNEYYVTERLINAVAAIDYPREKLEIQVLDDSTDDTQNVARAAVDRHRAKGLNIHYIHRTNRSGYKAGALDQGLKRAWGEFIAIFDADFVPPSDILKRSITHFEDPAIGMVQMRWEHLNRESTLLTRVQSILLDGHFVIEHTARNRSGRFFNFNGTAGIWRRQAIEDAGGWQHDTLTEDLDLSYRAQLAGWKFVYLPEVAAPGEIPIEITAFKSQQHRWTKGAIQVAMKLLKRIWGSAIPLKVKVEATFHLTNNFAYLLMLVLSLLMWPAMEIRAKYDLLDLFWWDVPLLMAATMSVGAFYACSQREIGRGAWTGIFYMPALMSLGIGLTINNTKAVLEGLSGQTGEFVRTAKFSDEGSARIDWRKFRYGAGLSMIPIAELAMGLYFTMLVLRAAMYEIYFMIPFLALFQFGYLYVGLLSLFQRPFSALVASFRTEAKTAS